MDINDLLEIVVQEKASDLHLTVGIPPTLRLHGQLIHLDLPPLKEADTRELISQLFRRKAYYYRKI